MFKASWKNSWIIDSQIIIPLKAQVIGWTHGPRIAYISSYIYLEIPISLILKIPYKKPYKGGLLVEIAKLVQTTQL